MSDTFVSIDAMINDIAVETVKILNATTSSYNPVSRRRILAIFIKNVIQITVLDALQEKPSGKPSKEEHYAFTSKNFQFIKGDIQNMVAEGFNKALNKFSGKDPDYYCQIKPFPEPKNKLVC
jgi:hypothetical protein